MSVTTILFLPNTMLLSLAIEFCPTHSSHAFSPHHIEQQRLDLNKCIFKILTHSYTTKQVVGHHHGNCSIVVSRWKLKLVEMCQGCIEPPKVQKLSMVQCMCSYGKGCCFLIRFWTECECLASNGCISTQEKDNPFDIHIARILYDSSFIWRLQINNSLNFENRLDSLQTSWIENMGQYRKRWIFWSSSRGNCDESWKWCNGENGVVYNNRGCIDESIQSL